MTILSLFQSSFIIFIILLQAPQIKPHLNAIYAHFFFFFEIPYYGIIYLQIYLNLTKMDRFFYYLMLFCIAYS